MNEMKDSPAGNVAVDEAAVLRHGGVANLVWLVALMLVAMATSSVMACIVPFAALGVALAGTVKWRHAAGAILGIWFVNQIVGFGFYDYPHTLNTVLWGVAIGVAALLATAAAYAVIRGLPKASRLLRVMAALVVAYAVYEAALMFAGVFLGTADDGFAPQVVAQLALLNGLWLAGLVALNEFIAVAARHWLKATPALLVRAS